MIESAIALPLLLCLLVASFDLLRISYNLLTVQFVSSRVMRAAVIGNLTAVEVQEGVAEEAKKFGVKVRPENISLCPIDVNPCAGVQIGDSQELMVLNVRVPTSGFILGPASLGLGRSVFNLSATNVGRMEPGI